MNSKPGDASALSSARRETTQSGPHTLPRATRDACDRTANLCSRGESHPRRPRAAAALLRRRAARAASPSAKLGATHVKQVPAARRRRGRAAHGAARLLRRCRTTTTRRRRLQLDAQIDGALGSPAARGAAAGELRALGDDDGGGVAAAGARRDVRRARGAARRARPRRGRRRRARVLARDVSGRVGALHGAQARVADTLAALDRLADVEQSTTSSPPPSLAPTTRPPSPTSRSWPPAPSAAAAAAGAAASSPGRKDLRSVHAELSAQVRAELERAVAAADGAAVVRFAALLPLGLSDAAAAAFTTWCDAQLAAAAAADGAAGASAQQLGAVLQRAGALCASAATVFEGKGGGGGGAEGRAARVQLVFRFATSRLS